MSSSARKTIFGGVSAVSDVLVSEKRNIVINEGLGIFDVFMGYWILNEPTVKFKICKNRLEIVLN